MFLSYVGGAAVLFFNLPSADFLSKAFTGAQAWQEPGTASEQPAAPNPTGEIDEPGKTFDGFTLYSCASETVSGEQAYLINMQRQVVHRWAVPFRKIWPNPPQIRHPLSADARTAIFACYLYPNGDLLAIFHGMDRSANGYGLAKLDKDSNVIWKYDANIHHDVDVGEDGTIYALRHAMVEQRPAGLEGVPPPWLVDSLVMLSPDGRDLQPPLPILDALADSPFRPLLSSLEVLRHKGVIPTRDEIWLRQDVLHTNSVHVLTRKLAPKFPFFRPGQVLISMRNVDTLAVLDTSRRAVVWATRGPWRAQHDARFLDNGHILLFDNLGAPKGSRVLEFDPQSHGFSWTCATKAGQPFFSEERGMSQRLPNGNTLVVNTGNKEMWEVSPAGQVVWSCATHGHLVSARRYSPEQVPFLKGEARARP